MFYLQKIKQQHNTYGNDFVFYLQQMAAP